MVFGVSDNRGSLGYSNTFPDHKTDFQRSSDLDIAIWKTLFENLVG